MQALIRVKGGPGSGSKVRDDHGRYVGTGSQPSIEAKLNIEHYSDIEAIVVSDIEDNYGEGSEDEKAADSD